MAPQSTPYALRVAMLAAVYFALARLSLAFAIPPGYATALWPPAGIALAALWLGGLRLWPGVWIGAAAANYTIEASAAAALVIGTGNALEALAGGWLAGRLLADRRGPFSQPRYVMRFFGVALAASTLAASVGVGELALSGGLPSGSALANWVTWWLGDATGMMIVTPLIVAWTRPGRVAWSARRAVECAALFCALAITAAEVFTGWLFGSNSLPLTYLLLPFVMWAAVRFGGREAVTACALVSAIALGATFAGSGPFAGHGVNASLLLQQAFVATLVATGLVLSGLMRQISRLAETERRAHEEMEHMVHLAAHDLQEPIRTVVNFTDLLQLRYAERLGAEGLEYLRFIAGGAMRGRQMIDEVLQLLEAGRRPLVLERTSSAAALAAALQGLKGAIESNAASVACGPLPDVHADARMLQSVFQNLVGNAIRYRDEAPPRVGVSAERTGGHWTFSVRDNGIGVDPRQHQEIFGMFKRRARLTFPDISGTGSGLALCKRIIERHGGRIWVESPHSGGSIFHFSLPAEEGRDDGTTS
jgi:signal transduction histidine kinase